MNLIDLSRKEILQKLCITRIEGSSMFPTLVPGDVLLFENINHGNTKIGDLVIFKHENKFICHRFLFKRKKNLEYEFLEKGDNCLNASWRNCSSLIGKVNKIKRSGNTIEVINPTKRIILILFLEVFLYKTLSYLAKIKDIFLKDRRIGVSRIVLNPIRKISYALLSKNISCRF